MQRARRQGADELPCILTDLFDIIYVLTEEKTISSRYCIRHLKKRAKGQAKVMTVDEWVKALM